jgi:phytoene dehydrogenase-like protein
MRELDCDVIVVGSGIGGLCSAAAMANRGYKVLVFEAGARPGGYCQSFTRKGFRFNTSVHKVGGPFPRDLVEAFLDEIGEGEPLAWTEFEEYIQVGSVRINAGDNNLKETLQHHFPDEAANLERFFTDMTALFQEFIYLERNKNNIAAFNPKLVPLFMKYQSITVEKLLDLYLTNLHLKGLIYALCDGVPNQLGMVMVVALNLLRGSSVLPVGGMETVLERLIRTVERSGGRLLLRSPVQKLIVEEGRVVGVEVNGRPYYSRFVVSNVDLRVTYRDLIGSEHLPARFMDKVLHRWRPSSSCFSVWLGLDCELSEFGWGAENVTYYQDHKRLFQMKEDLLREGGTLPSDTYCWIGGSANTDPTANPPGKAQMTLGIPVATKFENDWGLQNGKRGPAYRQTKLDVAERLIAVAERIVPGLRSHVQVLEVGTPLTYERYSGNLGGAYLGYAFDPSFILDRHRPESKGMLPGLYFSSNWSSMGGGVIKILMEALRGADLMLAEDGRDDFYHFESRHFFTRLDERSATSCPIS